MRIVWVPRRLLMALLLCSACTLAIAETEAKDGNRPEAWEHPWTVATIAVDGSWGVATELYFFQAIAQAVSNCKRMSLQQIGCGAQFRAIRAGWIIAMRCGNTNILGAEENIAAAQNAVAAGETALRENAAELPPCFRVITVDPKGNIIRHVPDSDRNGPTISESRE